MIKTNTDKYSVYRPEKKQLAAYGGLSGASGAERESPIGDDDNEEVRQRAVRALNLVLRFHTTFAKQLPALPPSHYPCISLNDAIRLLRHCS